jgi:hypothetical protein
MFSTTTPQEGTMTRLTMLFIAVALVLPGAALAMPAPDRDTGTRVALDKHGVDQAAANRKAAAISAYYASFGATKPLPAPVDEPAAVATDGNGVSWTLAIGSGIALVLVAGGLGVYAGRVIRPRHLGA